eukprot:1612585-Pyramimonas_sp.AAC.3
MLLKAAHSASPLSYPFTGCGHLDSANERTYSHHSTVYSRIPGPRCYAQLTRALHCQTKLDSWYQVAWTNREYRATNQKSENTERPLSSITSTWNLTGTVRLYHNVMLAVLDCTSLVQKLELDKELGKYFNRFAQVSQVHRHDATWT